MNASLLDRLTVEVAALEGEKTPDGLAHFLEAKGIRGKRNEGGKCPLANYLRERITSVDRTTVGFNRAYAGGTEDDYYAITDLGPVAEEFVHGFDGGLYPFLEA